MATYPSIAMTPDSRMVNRDGRDEEEADNGDVVVYSSYASDRRDFIIVHEGLDSTKFSTLQAFYNTNRNLAVDIVWPEDGVTYSGLRFGKNGWVPTVSKKSPLLRDLTVRLVGAA